LRALESSLVERLGHLRVGYLCIDAQATGPVLAESRTARPVEPPPQMTPT
jgi:hypothetical protein